MGLVAQIFSLFESPRERKASSHSSASDGNVLSLTDYWQDRQETYADEWTFEVKQNAADLITRVNMLLKELKVTSTRVASGWRPREINQRIGGAPRSYHITGQAVDLRDNEGQDFSKIIMSNKHLLHRYQLWLENPSFTRGNTNWVHLDIGTRPEKDLRMFNP
jgi:hypothetical protein